MDKARRMSQFLNKRRLEISEKEGRAWNSPITWRELATRCGMAENTLYRIQKGHGLPSDDNLFKMASIFGDEIYEIMGIDKDLAYLIQHQDNPAVKAVIQQAMKHAMRLQDNPTRLSELSVKV